MSCDCGDLYCGSCGPLQGNTRCFYCGKWAADIDDGRLGRIWKKLTRRALCGCKIAYLDRIAAEENAWLERQLSEEKRYREWDLHEGVREVVEVLTDDHE